MKEMVNHFLNYEFVYIFLFCSLIFLSSSIFIKRNIIKKISILLFSIFFVLFLFETSLSFFMPVVKISKYNKYLNNIDNKTIHKEKEIEYFDINGIKKKYMFDIQNLKIEDYSECKFIFDKEYTMYNNRFRVTDCNKNSKETYLFFGCSFTFGDALCDDETLPYYFSKLYDFNKNIVNCGVPGNSTNTIINILENKIFLPLTNKKSKIKYCFYSLVPDHIYRNFRYESKSGCMDGYLYKNKKWYIPTNIGKIKYIFTRSYIFRKIFLPIIDKYNLEYYEDYMIKSLKEINEMIEEKYDSKLTVIVWPDYYPDYYGNIFLSKLKKTNLDLIFLPEYFNSVRDDYKIKYDGHPTAKANKEIAEILYNHINKTDKENKEN